jgi:hypothetical protein
MQKNGVERKFYPNGQVESEITYVNGELAGVSRSWHPNGILASEIPIHKGEIEGVVKQWNDKGELLGSYELRNGTGVFKKWYENGQLELETPMVNGVENGRGRIWGESGELSMEFFFLNSKQVSRKKYLEACARDPSLPRYEENAPESKVKLHSTKYRLRKTPVSEAERKKHEDLIAKFQAMPNQAEARQWLAASPSGTIRTIGELDEEGTRETIEEGYAAGTQKIIVAAIESDEDKNETSNQLIVEIPAKGSKRKRVFEWVNELGQQSGFDPEDDWGQAELFIFFD